MLQPSSIELTEEQALAMKQMKALIADESDVTANLANLSAFLYDYLEDVNWVGFYMKTAEDLVLGPFQGLPACVRLPLNEGVCSTSIRRDDVVRVADVQAFPGHIACDAASAAEICVPLYQQDQQIGVLDIDSPSKARFTEFDDYFLSTLMKEVAAVL